MIVNTISNTHTTNPESVVVVPMLGELRVRVYVETRHSLTVQAADYLPLAVAEGYDATREGIAQYLADHAKTVGEALEGQGFDDSITYLVSATPA